MKDILSTFLNTDLVAFPDTKAVDSAGALATNGTEFIAALVNDYCWGPLQSLLAYTGQTPNGTEEGPSNSQFLEGLRRAFCYPGKVFAAAWNFDPASINVRAIKLIGQGVAKATYPLLDAAVYVGNANNAAVAAAGGKFYHADNSNGTSPNNTGAYLILPDMRGAVIRGLDTAAGVDPDGASRKLGHKQLDAFQGHGQQGQYRNEGTTINENTRTDTNTVSPGVTDGAPNKTALNLVGAGLIITDPTYGTVRLSTETRMVNIALDFYITY